MENRRQRKNRMSLFRTQHSQNTGIEEGAGLKLHETYNPTIIQNTRKFLLWRFACNT